MLSSYCREIHFWVLGNGGNEAFHVKWGLNEDHFSNLVLTRTRSSIKDLFASTESAHLTPKLTIWYSNSTLEWSRIQTALMLNNQPMQRAGQYRNIAYPTVKLLLALNLHGSRLGFTWLGQNFYGFPFFLHCYETLRGGLLLYWSHKGL